MEKRLDIIIKCLFIKKTPIMRDEISDFCKKDALIVISSKGITMLLKKEGSKQILWLGRFLSEWAGKPLKEEPGLLVRIAAALKDEHASQFETTSPCTELLYDLEEVMPSHPEFKCPKCGAIYGPHDYNPDLFEWLCSECKGVLPKA